ncbi:hypothetical protein Pcinc_017368 [Petrolisthes cinctipes]|uniref:Uncharacterized protein n=1 Tax=Petrolisthes cinctipes TaxID=88211 RepID=A0AAE1FQU9_PETCI|nr:hypothetical protein Pcinc_017368 [Petrolisthes cinctipes]
MGAEQQQRKRGPELLQNGPLKVSLTQFILNEITNEYYDPVVGNKTVYVSHGGKFLRLKTDSSGMLVVEEPSKFQGQHEEADTLMTFHAYRIGGRVVVRSSDTDVVVILIALAAKMPEALRIVMDFGSGYNRRIYGFKGLSNINKARYKSFIKLTGGKKNVDKLGGRSLPDTLNSDKDSKLENVPTDKPNVMSDTEVDLYDVDTFIDEGSESDDTDIEMLEYDSEPWSDDSESDYEDDY